METANDNVVTAPNHIGLNIKEARVKRGLTQLELALAAGGTPASGAAYICRLEAGHHEPALRTLDKIAAVLKVPRASLLKDRK